MQELMQIPGIGKEAAKDLINLGIRRLSDLHGANPEQLYEQHCIQKGQAVDRCVLYQFRCAVYFVNNEQHDPEKLKWWNWKDV